MATTDNNEEQVDSLGISSKENLQIDALKLGATPMEVASLSREPVEDIPQQFITSEYEDHDPFAGNSEYEEPILTTPPKKAEIGRAHV